ncbi:MAG: DUF3800 domain-containing protein [Elusimicrobia bacterium]|nr:DUF3800 domain-containing protein [Elusimicrobiota bacterium]
MSDRFSDHLVFVDESGDHGLDNIDPDYPMFVLAFCIMRKEDYVATLTPAIQRFKIKHFGHDAIVLHERDIRKDQGNFGFLKTKDKKQEFIDELTAIITAAPFKLICSVIHKKSLREKYSKPDNPYHIALAFGLERVSYYLRDGENYEKIQLPLEIAFVDKKSNSAGLQLADLVARPVGMSIFKPNQHNRAFDALRSKFYASGAGKLEGYGLKCFP